MNRVSKIMVGVGLAGSLYGTVGLAENMCCNPVTYVCEDCQACPNVYGNYDMLDKDGNVVGTVTIQQTAEALIMRECRIDGKSGKSRCTEYTLEEE